MNYYERCLKRLEEAADLASTHQLYYQAFEFSQIHVGKSSANKNKLYCNFRGVSIPLTQQEMENLFVRAEHKFNLQTKAHELKALEEL